MPVALRDTTRNFYNTFFLAVAYAAAFYCVQFFLHKMMAAGTMPTEQNIASWDGGWDRALGVNGYQFDRDSPSNSGFFVLLPLVWKLSHLNAWGMSVLNILFFA